MQTFGDFLKGQREAKNISLKQVAHSTNVTERYLDFIEKDEFEKVPKGPYIRGYISLYAGAIGINAHEALDRFDSQCQKGNRAEDIQQEISKHKIRERPLILSLNKGKWLLLCSAMLGLLIFVAYHFSSEDGNKSLVLANVQGPESKGLQTAHTIKSEDNIPPLTINAYSKSSSGPKGLQKDMENRDNESVRNFPSLGKGPNPQAKEFSKSASLPSLLLDQRREELSKQTSDEQEVVGHSQNFSKIGNVTVTTLSDSELTQKSADQIVLKTGVNAKLQKTPEPSRAVMEVTSDERRAKESLDHEKNIEVVATAVCADVKRRKPFGKNDSFKWSTDRVYIWNSIKCDSHLSSIRHIYYFAGKKVSDIVLDIRSPTWKTWSYKSIADKSFIGPWRVDITTADGELLKRVYFEIS